uniref:Uncharacterized protein n=1 Tax=Acrobeloides nanus TaxID=290746 RepID=A0A914DXX9_9BILA
MTIFALADGLYFLYDLSRRILLPFYVLTVDNDRIKQLYKYDIVMYNFTISMQTLLISMRNDFRSLIFTLDMIFCYIMLVQIQKLDQGISSSSQNFTLFKKIKAKFWKQTNTNQVATINSSNNTHP